MEKLEALVLDTLYDKRLKKVGSCFVVNEAGQELLCQDAAVLPVIERTIIHVVSPELANNPQVKVIDDIVFKETSTPGLDYVLGAYATIGTKHAPERVFDFLDQCCDEIKEEAVQSIIGFFQTGRNQHRSVIPCKQLADFYRRQSVSKNKRIRKRAEQVIVEFRLDEFDIPQ